MEDGLIKWFCTDGWILLVFPVVAGLLGITIGKALKKWCKK